MAAESDYLKREDVISILNNAAERDPALLKHGSFTTAKGLIITMPPTDVRPAMQWIPVEKRLPDKYVHVWAACKMEGRENWVIEVQNYGIPYRKNPWGDIPLLENGRMKVYAWMPIEEPEPPELTEK